MTVTYFVEHCASIPKDRGFCTHCAQAKFSDRPVWIIYLE